MDKAIGRHFQKNIIEKTRLTGGYTFQTWLLTLSDNQKVIFRTQRDFETGGGRKIIIADVLERERFFYNNINKKIGHICPDVYVVDGTLEHYETSYCIMEYIEGIPLNQCFAHFDSKAKNDILYKIGEITAQINSVEIDSSHPYITSRGIWEEYFAGRLRERFTPLLQNGIISQDEIDKIIEKMRNQTAEKTMSFLHLDMRHVNMISNNGNLFILDAENCEFGDPLWDLATIDVADELNQALIEGYKSRYNGDMDLENELYFLYKIERQALVSDLFMNLVKDANLAQYHAGKFNELKKRVLG